MNKSHLEGLLEQFPGQTASDSHPVGSGSGTCVSISNKFIGNA